MGINKLKIIDFGILTFFLICFLTINPSYSHAKSNNFPPYEVAPKLTKYVSDGTFNNTYYISPSGNDTTGDGSINRPWATINGARTGGAGSAVSKGDLVYFRGGTYTARSGNRVVNHSYYYINVDGTSSDRIVFTAYPGEVPTFTANSPDHLSMTIEGDYIVFDSLTFTTGSMNISGGQHAVIQNCTFEGTPYNPNSSQISPYYFYVHDGGHHAIIRNNYFAVTNAHAIKLYGSSNMPTDVIIEYNRFYTGNIRYGLINFKTAITNDIIRYNRFEGVTTDVISIGSSYSGKHNGLYVHHNVFDSCSKSIFQKLQTSSTGELLNLEFHDNLVLNASSGNRDFFVFDDESVGGTETSPIGEVWNNALYNIVDAIDPERDTNHTNYPSFWNYNAYASTAIKNTAENQNGLSASNWQGNALILESHGITRTGVAGNRFYTIEDNNKLIGAGRYGDTIGGFRFDGVPAETNEVVSPKNLRIVATTP